MSIKTHKIIQQTNFADVFIIRRLRCAARTWRSYANLTRRKERPEFSAAASFCRDAQQPNAQQRTSGNSANARRNCRGCSAGNLQTKEHIDINF